MENFIAQDFQFIAITTVLAAFSVFAITWFLEKSPLSNWFKNSEGIAVSFITIPAFLFGLSISTLSSSVWDGHVSANSSLVNESTSVRTLTSIASILPTADGQKLNLATKNYVSTVLTKEWPAMKTENPAGKTIALSEFENLNTVANKIAMQTNQRSSIEERLVSAIDSLRHERLQRLSLAYDSTNFSRWPSVFVLSFLLMLTVGLLQLRSPRAMRISLVMGALCIGSTMLFLYLNLSPYHGMNAVNPQSLEESLKLIPATLPNAEK
jgi:Protein of unknown function (DUF4239)